MKIKLTQKVLPLAIVLVVALGGTVYYLKSHAATCLDTNVQLDSRGICVEYIQRMTNGFNKYIASDLTPTAQTLVVDGNYDSATKDQITRWQSYSNSFVAIPTITADGVVDAKTWNKYCDLANYVNRITQGVVTSNTITDTLDAAKSAGCINIPTT